MRQNGFKKDLLALRTREFFDVRQSGSCNFSVLKNSLVKINIKLNSKPYDHLYFLVFLLLYPRKHNTVCRTGLERLNLENDPHNVYGPSNTYFATKKDITP